MEVLFFETPADWRAWLEENHASATEVEVGFRKRKTGLPSITWSEAVDEALCFGWIDGVRHTIDEASYRNRFTPRRPRSNWSKINIEKVRALIEQGRMQSAGLAAFEARAGERSGVYSFEADEQPALTPEQEARLKADAAAWADFQARPAGYRRAAIHWVTSAKREPTRERRLGQLIECSAQGRPVPPLSH